MMSEYDKGEEMFDRKISENGMCDGMGKWGKSGLLADIGKRIAAGLSIVAVASAMALGCAGCDAGDAARVLQDVSEIATTIDESGVFDGGGNGGAVAENESSADYQWTEWDADKYPDYYRIVGKAVVDSDVPEGEIWYSDLDELGRTQRAVGRITYEMYEESKGTRDEFGANDDPSGWPEHNEKIEIDLGDGKTYHGYSMNRSHCCGDSLGGKAIKQNCITGLRTQNVGKNNGKGGMQYTEKLATDYLENNHDGVVYYSATPVYNGDELIPRSVFVDIKSNDGSIDQQVEVFNACRGIKLDFYTGEVSYE